MVMRIKILFIIIAFLVLLISGCENSGMTQENKEVISTNTESEFTEIENNVVIPTHVLGNSMGNILNGGLVAEKDDWIYYCNTDDDWNLYKTNKDGTEKIQLTDYSVISINVTGEFIYFRDYIWGETACIVKIDTDGSNEKIIIDEPTHDVFVVDDWIYYVNINDDLLYRISTDGSNQEVLVDTKVERFFIHNNDIIYNDLQDGIIYKKRLHSKDKMILIEKKVSSFVVSDESIYYSSSDGKILYKADIEGNNETMLLDGRPFQSFNIKDDWIYYSVGVDIGTHEFQGLYKMKTDGKNNTKLSEDKVRDINLIDDWIYYLNRSDEQNLYKMKTDGTQRQKVK